MAVWRLSIRDAARQALKHGESAMGYTLKKLGPFETPNVAPNTIPDKGPFLFRVYERRKHAPMYINTGGNHASFSIPIDGGYSEKTIVDGYRNLSIPSSLPPLERVFLGSSLLTIGVESRNRDQVLDALKIPVGKHSIPDRFFVELSTPTHVWILSDGVKKMYMGTTPNIVDEVVDTSIVLPALAMLPVGTLLDCLLFVSQTL